MDDTTTVNAQSSRTQRTILYDDDDVRVVHTHTARHCYSIVSYKSASEVQRDRAVDRRRLALLLPLRSRPFARSTSR